MVLDQIVNLVIRPPRAPYEPEIDLLGPVFQIKGREYRRHDIQLVNKRGHFLECSHYRPGDGEPDAEAALPCVIYCHGNSGCRADANDAALVLLPLNITVMALDFSGSGRSQGEYVSLGKYEVDDLEAAVDYLRKEGLAKKVGLWGRSMGAVTALMYGAKDPTVAGMIVDSPFSNLSNLILELVDFYKIPLPKFTVKMGVLPMMRRAIRQKAAFDINDLDTLSLAASTFIPSLFAHAKGDTFIQPHHSKDIYDKYAGDKNRILFTGDHNSPRPEFFFDSVSIFLHNCLDPPPVRVRRRPRDDRPYRFEALDFRAIQEQQRLAKARSQDIPEANGSSSGAGGSGVGGIGEPSSGAGGAGGAESSRQDPSQAAPIAPSPAKSDAPADSSAREASSGQTPVPSPRAVISMEALARALSTRSSNEEELDAEEARLIEEGGLLADENEEDEYVPTCGCYCRRLHELLHFPSKKLKEGRHHRKSRKTIPIQRTDPDDVLTPAPSGKSIRAPLIPGPLAAKAP